MLSAKYSSKTRILKQGAFRALLPKGAIGLVKPSYMLPLTTFPIGYSFCGGRGFPDLQHR